MLDGSSAFPWAPARLSKPESGLIPRVDFGCEGGQGTSDFQRLAEGFWVTRLKALNSHTQCSLGSVGTGSQDPGKRHIVQVSHPLPALCVKSNSPTGLQSSGSQPLG